MLWNGAIGSLSVSFAKLVTSVLIMLLAFRQCGSFATTGSVATAVIMSAALVGYMIFTCVYLKKKSDILSLEVIKERVGNMYVDVKLVDKYAYTYYPSWLLRRFL